MRLIETRWSALWCFTSARFTQGFARIHKQETIIIVECQLILSHDVGKSSWSLEIQQPQQHGRLLPTSLSSTATSPSEEVGNAVEDLLQFANLIIALIASTSSSTQSVHTDSRATMDTFGHQFILLLPDEHDLKRFCYHSYAFGKLFRLPTWLSDGFSSD